MQQARPGYERVRSDTRSAPIPDLPIDAYGPQDGDTDDRFATAAFLSYFALLLLIGIAIWYAFASPSAPRIATAQAQPPSYYLAK